MSRANKVLLTILVALLLVAAVIAGLIISKTAGRGPLDQPDLFSLSRYEGTLAKAETLSDDSEIDEGTDEETDVVIVVRFFDGGDLATVASPTLEYYSELTLDGDDHTYVEHVITDGGESAATPGAANDDARRWSFEPSGSGDMSVSIESAGGDVIEEASLDDSDWEDTDGEEDLARIGPASDEPAIDFGDNGKRFVGQTRPPKKPVLSHEAAEVEGMERVNTPVILRFPEDMKHGTATYPELGCHSVLERNGDQLIERVLVGTCASGGIWFVGQGSSPDDYIGMYSWKVGDTPRSITDVDLAVSNWEDTDGEVGLARSGPAVEAEEATDDSDTQAQGSCEAEEFDALVDGWPNFTGTHVNYCDGSFAQAGAKQTDWIVDFEFIDGKWQVLESDGSLFTTGRACYDFDRLRERGAPEEFLDTVVECSAEDYAHAR